MDFINEAKKMILSEKKYTLDQAMKQAKESQFELWGSSPNNRKEPNTITFKKAPKNAKEFYDALNANLYWDAYSGIKDILAHTSDDWDKYKEDDANLYFKKEGNSIKVGTLTFMEDDLKALDDAFGVVSFTVK